MATDLESLAQSIIDLTTRIKLLEQKVGGSASVPQVNASVLIIQEDLNEIKADIASLQSAVSTLQTLLENE